MIPPDQAGRTLDGFVMCHYQILQRLRHLDFDPRARLLLELILAKSFGVGRSRAYLPRLEWAGLLTRISRGMVSQILDDLERAAVIERCAAGVYAVRLPVENWKVASRLNWTPALHDLEARLDEDPLQMVLPDQKGEPWEPPNLNEALRALAQTSPAQCRGSGMPGRGRNVGAAEQEPVSDRGKRDPDLGTGDPITGSTVTYRRNHVLEKERLLRLNVKPDPAAGTLLAKVRAFVGEHDWRRYWNWPSSLEIFEDPDRAQVLEGSLAYCLAGIKEGVAVRKCTGAMLWAQFKNDLSHRRAAAVTSV